MSNVSSTFLVSGIIGAVATLYAYKRGITYEKVMSTIAENESDFTTYIINLFELGKELLLKIYDFFKKIIEEMIFKFRVKFDDIKNSMEA